MKTSTHIHCPWSLLQIQTTEAKPWNKPILISLVPILWLLSPVPCSPPNQGLHPILGSPACSTSFHSPYSMSCLDIFLLPGTRTNPPFSLLQSLGCLSQCLTTSPSLAPSNLLPPENDPLSLHLSLDTYLFLVSDKFLKRSPYMMCSLFYLCCFRLSLFSKECPLCQ